MIPLLSTTISRPSKRVEVAANIQSLELRCLQFGVAPVCLGYSPALVVLFALPAALRGGDSGSSFFGNLRDMQMPLPMLTLAVLNNRWVLAGIGCACIPATLFVVQRRASMRYLFGPILAVILVLLAITTIGLILGLDLA